jgi:hypothetical protein
VYTKPASTTAISGATISSTYYNSLADDIASEITASLPVNGTKAMTAPLPLSDGTAGAPSLAFGSDTTRGLYKTTNGLGWVVGGSLVAELTSSGWLNASGTAYQVTPTIAWADIASAATTDIGAVDCANLRVTGTTGITAFGTVASGTLRRLRFAGALILTHNGTSLILPTGASITTAANDSCEAVSLGSGNWIVTSYQRASGIAWVDNYAGTVTSVAAGSGLSGGTITSTGTIAIDTNNTVGVGCVAWLQNGSGGTISSGATTGGGNLTILYGSGGSFVSSATTVSGTWRNISGIALQNAWSGMWIRTA